MQEIVNNKDYIQYTLPRSVGLMTITIIGDGYSDWKIVLRDDERIRVYSNVATKEVRSLSPGCNITLTHIENGYWKVTGEGCYEIIC